MEQIIKNNERYFYKGNCYHSADSAYSAFREDYHKSLGNATHNRLDRIGSRKERIHGFGFIFDNDIGSTKKICTHIYNCRLMGLVGISYVRSIGAWDYADVPDDRFDKWFDYVFSRGSGMLRTLGIRKKVGRTSKRLKTRYR